ncbi:MAG TPA: hypothetical protein VHB21_11580, partial [Minicystis sp.]|nr:hypothetical protein [Minicystis sp.]
MDDAEHERAPGASGREAPARAEDTPRARRAKRLVEIEGQLQALGARSDRLSTWRGISFLAALGGAAAVFFGHGPRAAWIPVALVFAAFAALVVRHAILVTRSIELEARARITRAAIARIEHDWDRLGDGGARFAEAEHAYAGDLDVLGPASVFQLVSTAHTAEGERLLASWLLAPAAPDEVRARQEAARELAAAPRFREELELHAMRANTAGRDGDPLAAWARARPEAPLDASPIARVGRFVAVATLALFAASEALPDTSLGGLRFAWLGSVFVGIGVMFAVRAKMKPPLS